MCNEYLCVTTDLYYVRVIGSLDNSCPAKVDTPWSPSGRNTDDVNLCSPFKCNLLDSPSHGSPRESPLTVKAYAGPMSSSQVARSLRVLTLQSYKNCQSLNTFVVSSRNA